MSHVYAIDKLEYNVVRATFVIRMKVLEEQIAIYQTVGIDMQAFDGKKITRRILPTLEAGLAALNERRDENVPYTIWYERNRYSEAWRLTIRGGGLDHDDRVDIEISDRRGTHYDMAKFKEWNPNYEHCLRDLQQFQEFVMPGLERTVKEYNEFVDYFNKQLEFFDSSARPWPWAQYFRMPNLRGRV